MKYIETRMARVIWREIQDVKNSNWYFDKFRACWGSRQFRVIDKICRYIRICFTVEIPNRVRCTNAIRETQSNRIVPILSPVCALFRTRVYRLPPRPIIQTFVNICLLNATGWWGATGGVDGLVKWKSKSTGTARPRVHDRCARPEFSIVNHNRRTTPTCAPAVVQAGMQMRVTLTEFPVFH